MKIGFTGTRSGMSDKQKKEVRRLLANILSTDEVILIHGGCVGADTDFHNIAREFGDSFYIRVFPGHFKNDPKNTKYKGNYEDADEIKESQTHFKRNRDIVDNCDLLIATPFHSNQIDFIEFKKGGTKYTVDYAIKINRPIEIIYK